MVFYNVQTGDAPYLKSLADTYTMSDNYHQAVIGGTGANHIMLGYGAAIWFSDGGGRSRNPAEQSRRSRDAGTRRPGHSSALCQIENPDPKQGQQLLYPGWVRRRSMIYARGTPPKANYGGGSYVDCADRTQRGVGAVQSYLDALTPRINPKCQAGHYYLVNNYNPGYFGDGKNSYTDKDPNNTVFTIPPSNVSNIGDRVLGQQRLLGLLQGSVIEYWPSRIGEFRSDWEGHR